MLNLDFDKSSSGLFVWGRIPSSNSCDLAFTDKLLHEHGVFITPGSIFGSNGKGYVRMSLCLNENTLNTILNRIQKNDYNHNWNRINWWLHGNGIETEEIL